MSSAFCGGILAFISIIPSGKSATVLCISGMEFSANSSEYLSESQNEGMFINRLKNGFFFIFSKSGIRFTNAEFISNK